MPALFCFAASFTLAHNSNCSDLEKEVGDLKQLSTCEQEKVAQKKENERLREDLKVFETKSLQEPDIIKIQLIDVE